MDVPLAGIGFETATKWQPNKVSTMPKIAFAVSLVVGASQPLTAFAAEPLVIDVWPGKTPADVGINGQETSRIHPSPLVGPTKLITKVTKPTLTIYQPVKDKNTKPRW